MYVVHVNWENFIFLWKTFSQFSSYFTIYQILCLLFKLSIYSMYNNILLRSFRHTHTCITYGYSFKLIGKSTSTLILNKRTSDLTLLQHSSFSIPCFCSNYIQQPNVIFCVICIHFGGCIQLLSLTFYYSIQGWRHVMFST